MTTRAIIFDLDGLIVDTEASAYRSWAELYAEHGCELPVDEWVKVIGTWEPLFDPQDYLETSCGQKLAWGDLAPRRRERELQLAAEQPLLPGVGEFLAGAEDAGLRLAIASSSSRDWVEWHLGRLGVAERFEAVVTRDDVAATKPKPDLYLEALRRLGLRATEAFAIEDSHHGVVAAEGAGLPVVVVPNALTSGLDLSAATLVLPSLAGVSAPELAALVDERRP